MSLPSRAFQSLPQLTLRSVTAGFNRDEGSLFYLMMPNFLANVDTGNGLSDTNFRELLKALLCPDWGPACAKPGCVERVDCAERVSALVAAYDWERGSSVLRGQCCSKDPNILRLQRMLTDQLFVCPMFRFLGKMHEHGVDAVRSYTFAADDELPSWLPDMRSSLGAFHFSELFFIMGNKDGPGGNLPYQGGALGFGLGWTAQDRVISANMSGSWGDLIRQEDLPFWPQWTSGQMMRFALDVPNNVDTVPMDSMRAQHHCDYFDELGVKLLQDVL